ncbi:GrpB family protein [Oceanobacillus bengalensis]|uniref:GrpB family protein n=1 Tax=Oceanobacillus bengalensis TaxID=1435466 RepID=UPI0024824179|nr:GrpB family protein [Oceanobacillus bengalensis]
MLGVDKGTVHLVKHDKKWKAIFQSEKALLEKLISEHIVEIQHFGSTSIRHIKAKPIIDILIGVKSLKDTEHFNWKTLQEVNIGQRWTGK